MLEAAGFVDIEVRGGYRSPADGDDDFVVFIARK